MLLTVVLIALFSLVGAGIGFMIGRYEGKMNRLYEMYTIMDVYDESGEIHKQFDKLLKEVSELPEEERMRRVCQYQLKLQYEDAEDNEK